MTTTLRILCPLAAALCAALFVVDATDGWPLGAVLMAVCAGVNVWNSYRVWRP